MLRSTAAASVLEFDQTLSLSGFAWHALLVLSNLRYLKISLVLRRIIIIIIMKIIYIAPNPLKGSRRFTKSVTATLQFT